MTSPTLTATGPSSSNIGSIIAFNYKAGRQSKTENFAAGTGSITIRNPQNMPAQIVLEARVDIAINSIPVVTGYVTDISYQYGMVPNEDIAIISLEGYLAFIGRGYLRNFLLGGGTTGFEATRLGNALTGSSATITNVNTRSLTFGPTTVSGDGQNILAQLVSTEQGRLYEGATSLSFYGRDVTFDASLPPTSLNNFRFTDTNPSSTGVAYDVVEFASFTENFFTQVTVNPSGLTTQQAGTGRRNLQIASYDETNAQALDLAQYALAEFNSNNSVPVSISTKNSLAWALDPARIIGQAGVGFRLPIIFRGTTFNTVIEGWTISATPEDVRYTFKVSGEQQNAFFILDDPIYGVLDSDKLSF